MAELGKIVAICLIGAVLVLLLKQNHPELAMLLALSICIGAILYALQRMETVLTLMEQLAQAGGLTEDLLKPLVKTVGIALISRIGSELCRDANQGAMATVVETAGAFSAVIVSLPLLMAVWELLRGML